MSDVIDLSSKLKGRSQICVETDTLILSIYSFLGMYIGAEGLNRVYGEALNHLDFISSRGFYPSSPDLFSDENKGMIDFTGLQTLEYKLDVGLPSILTRNIVEKYCFERENGSDISYGFDEKEVFRVATYIFADVFLSFLRTQVMNSYHFPTKTEVIARNSNEKSLILALRNSDDIMFLPCEVIGAPNLVLKGFSVANDF